MSKTIQRFIRALAFVALFTLPLLPTQQATAFVLGDASDYAILFEGGGGNTLQITNVTTNTAGSGAGQGGGIGNIGVGNTGQATDSGPSFISGRIDFSAPNTGQFSNNNAGNTFIGGSSTPSDNYNVAAVTSALNTINALNTALGNVNGTNVSVNGNTTINGSAGTLGSGVGFTNAEFFDVTSFSLNNGQNLTINGDGHDVVFNFTASTNFHGNVILTGGLTADNVIFNFVGGSGLQNGPTLSINNGGGSPSHPDYLSQGIFLDPNGVISVTNSNVLGRVFGGDTHDFQYVSGSNITAPGGQVPEPGATVLLMGLGLAFLAGAKKKFSP
jgi:PEP-CTERM motif